MQTVISKDGTRIAYDRSGQGPAVILVAGAMTTRQDGSQESLAALLSHHFSVYNYDRRGRGDSGENLPYSVEREIEDIEALIDLAGGKASLYGHSSGASLALLAAARLAEKVEKLALYEAPYNDDPQAMKDWQAYVDQLAILLESGKNGEAIGLFMKLTGASDEQVAGAQTAPFWPAFEALGPSLAHDHIGIMGQTAGIPVEIAAKIKVPALVMDGADSYPFMHPTAVTLCEAIPNARGVTLPGQTHEVDPQVLARELEKFLLFD